MCDKKAKPIDINEQNIEQTVGHWTSLIDTITADGRIPYITLNLSAISFLCDNEKIRDWQYFINELCDYAHGISVIDKGVNFWAERMCYPPASITERDNERFHQMIDRYVMRQKVIIELSFPWTKSKKLNELMDLFLTAALRGENEGPRPMEVEPPSAPPGEQEPEWEKVISVDVDESDDEGGVRGSTSPDSVFQQDTTMHDPEVDDGFDLHQGELDLNRFWIPESSLRKETCCRLCVLPDREWSPALHCNEYHKMPALRWCEACQHLACI